MLYQLSCAYDPHGCVAPFVRDKYAANYESGKCLVD